LKNPHVWERLREALAAAGITKESYAVSYKEELPAAGVTKESHAVSYEDCRKIRYLEAVVREALRVLPGVSLPLERYVPKGGYRLPNGDFLPQGVIVGVNPYLVCRNKSFWGPDSEEFRPERWLRDEKGGETEEQFKIRLQKMNDVDLSFGAGPRICIGKPLALMQLYKVVARIVTLYRVKLVDPKKEWEVTNSWFPRQEGWAVLISRK
jgi:cytochrome P450